jgi:hypothetical protein
VGNGLSGDAGQGLLGSVVGNEFQKSCSVFHEALEAAGLRFIGDLRAIRLLEVRLEAASEIGPAGEVR